MRKSIVLFVCAAMLMACGKSSTGRSGAAEKFAEEVRLRTTPVKDQGKSKLCWAYAMLATIETEHIMMGDSVNLSPSYVARELLESQARRCFLSEGKDEPSLRGTAPMLIRMIQEYGAMPYDSYNSEDVDCNALERRIGLIASRQNDMKRLDRLVADALDDALGSKPKIVFMFGMEYTPCEFARSVCMKDEYVAMTSFDHHPFGQAVTLELPDNTTGEKFANVPIDSLMKRIEKSIRSGHPVCWEGDVSESGFSFAKGVADTDIRRCTQERRQQDYDLRRTTDDHCMELVGLARDRNGRLFFIAKNSWGTRNLYGGFMYVSEDYIRLKTVAVVVKNTV